MNKKQDYLLGDSDPELQRLGVQHRVWAEQTHGAWRRGIRSGARVLDVGCGPGFTSLELAEYVGPDGQIVALDQSRRFLDFLEAQCRVRGVNNVQCLQGRLEEAELKDGFDAIYARWVFCFLREPAGVVKRLATLLSPGGRLITLDYFNYRAFCVAPRIPEMEVIVDAIQTSWHDAGGSLEVQGEMGQWMTDAGLELCEVRQVGGIVTPGSPLWEWPRSFLRAYLPQLVERGYLDGTLVDRFWS
ncbi:MAG: class I SAM-dependent methyltransferase, partial [Xanthomonadales bacterium]|nr:class I SAM-dependent methyltransferase [Xanthomonadales bacterium]